MKYKNNPLNIRHSSKFTWLGEVTHFNGFCVFSSQFFCYRAAVKILLAYKKRGIVSIKDIISTWAPSSDNNPTSNYIDFVCNRLDMNPNDSFWSFPFNSTQMEDLLFAMSCFETGDSACIDIKKLHVAVSIYSNILNN